MPKLYTIGEVSELLNVPKSTIRFWDEQGLIHSLRHEENGYRMFNIDDIFIIGAFFFCIWQLYELSEVK